MEPHSEASKLLEAALEQMDGIIQGAKYEIPNYADFQQAPTNNANANAALAHSSNGAGAASPGQTNGNGVSGQGKNPRAPVSSGRVGAGSLLSEALRSLRTAILDAGEDDLAHLATEADEETVRFLARWLQNNPGPGGARAHSRGGGGVDGDVLFELEERLARAEADRDSSAMRADMATEQLDRQGARLVDLEQLLQAKKELLRKTDQALERERASRRALEEENEHRRSTSPHFSEVARLRARCSELEAENQELRAICGGNRTPKYLPISPGARPRDLSSPQQQGRSRRSPMATEDSSPEEPSPRKGQLVDHDLPPPSAADTSVDVSSPSSGRPARGFKKIFGKIKRSNSGGHLEDKKRGGMTHQPDTPEEFRRGGFRATAGGRLGHRDPRRTNGSSSSVERPSAALAAAKTSRPVSEWSVDTVCTWLECLGLGAYCPEVKKSVGTGAQLAAMSFGDLEHKLNVRHYLHRKKLFLALQARQQQQDGRHDPEGQLDFHWVMRWLDDVGLPQYKDAFVEARVDGRVLNVLTTEDLFLMKVTNLLHHMSLRRGIQILRANHFEPDCLKRRALPGDVLTPGSVALWSNHRVMEWLKQVDLSEYAPNLRGSGVHGALLVAEPRFTDGVMAALLSIPSSKTLLRRHLSIHFKELVGGEVMREKRAAEQPGSVPLNPSAKARPRQGGGGGGGGGQFTLKRKKSKAAFDCGDLLCPFEQQQGLGNNNKSP